MSIEQQARSAVKTAMMIDEEIALKSAYAFHKAVTEEMIGRIARHRIACVFGISDDHTPARMISMYIYDDTAEGLTKQLMMISEKTHTIPYAIAVCGAAALAAYHENDNGPKVTKMREVISTMFTTAMCITIAYESSYAVDRNGVVISISEPVRQTATPVVRIEDDEDDPGMTNPGRVVAEVVRYLSGDETGAIKKNIG